MVTDSSRQRSVGVQDLPVGGIGEDVLGLENYARALATFVRECKTPISIGIQGDWGLGKTSLMQMMEHQLISASPPVYSYWVNSWQISQFDLGERLPFVLLQTICGKLSHGDLTLKSALDKVGSLVSRVGRIALHASGRYLGEVTGTDPVAEASKIAGIFDDPGKALEDFKKEFAALCEKRCQSDPAHGVAAGRIVIFLDDLDRLLPERAVELMEVIKNFLDVPHVIFVLACDYQVVVRGLERRFGISIKELGGRSFFDKIIQVPFRMPQKLYQIERYLQYLLKEVGFQLEDADIKVCVDLVRYSIGFNPRSLKRHCNTLLLLRLVLECSEDDSRREMLSDPLRLKLLFSTLCMEVGQPVLYNYILSAPLNETLATLSSDETVRELAGNPELFPDGNPSIGFVEFARLFFQLIDKDNSGVIDPSELDAIQMALSVSAITSINTELSITTESDGRREALIHSFINRFPEETQGAIRELLGAVASPPFRISKAKGLPYLVARSSIDGSEWFYIEILETAPYQVRLIFACTRDEPLPEEHVQPGMATYYDGFVKVGYNLKRDSATIRTKLRGGAAGCLNICFDAREELKKRDLAQRMLEWYTKVGNQQS